MPLNETKIVSIILEQSNQIEERCNGYREELIEVVSEILQYERSHRVSATSIQKQINEKCDAAARFLVTRKGRDGEVEQSES